MFKNDTNAIHPGASTVEKDWQQLFDLLPEIKKTRRFGRLVGSKLMPDGNLSVPFWLEDEIVSKFFNTAYLLGLVLVFDWAGWSEGIEILNDPDADFRKYDMNTLCKLLTFVVRCDKFCEGYMINCFENGTMPRIIEAMRLKVFY